MIKSKIEVEITKIYVDSRFFCFYYKITVNGKIRAKKGYYSGDYQNGRTIKEWTKELEKGHAVELAVQTEF